MLIRLNNFDGIRPAIERQNLPDGAALRAQDCDLTEGAIQMTTPLAWRQTGKPANWRWIFHLPNRAHTADNPITDTRGDAVHYTAVMLPEDNAGIDENFYAAVNGTLLRANTEPVGVEAPTAAPTQTGTVALRENQPVVDRYFVVTWVNGIGEEGPPSPPLGPIVMDPEFSTAEITPGANPYVKWRLYMNSGSPEYAGFFFVAEGNGTTPMNVSPAMLKNLNEPLATTFLDPPPTGIHHIKLLPSGAIVGLVGSQIVYSDPNYRYGWPADSAIELESLPKGIGVLDQAHVVVTDAAPVLIQGTLPGEMFPRSLDGLQSCASDRSIVEMPGAVGWAGPEGFQVVTNSGNELLTLPYFTREQWQAFNPSSMIAAWWKQSLVIFYTWSGKAEDIDALNKMGGNTSGAIPASGSIWFTPGRAPTIRSVTCTAAFVHPRTNQLLILNQGVVMSLEQAITNDLKNLATSLAGTDLRGYTKFQWRSKTYVAAKPINVSVAQAYGDYSDLTLKVFADDVQQGEFALTDGKIRKLRGGFKAYRWSFELSGYGRVTQFEAATDARELGQA